MECLQDSVFFYPLVSALNVIIDGLMICNKVLRGAARKKYLIKESYLTTIIKKFN